jgi:hypothetical protein
MSSLLNVCFWITGAIGSIAAVQAAGFLGLLAFLVLIAALLR